MIQLGLRVLHRSVIIGQHTLAKCRSLGVSQLFAHNFIVEFMVQKILLKRLDHAIAKTVQVDCECHTLSMLPCEN